MAKYDTTKFYWLQLKEDFFDEDAIDWLEEQPNGKVYSLFYLKLCLKSLRTHGVLIRQVGNMLVPYDHVKLGELTKTNPDTVMVAMNLLINIGLVQKLENGELYLTQVEHMIGSQSKSAFKKQQQRLTHKNTILIDGGQKEDKCPPNIEKELEKELELEKEKELEKKQALQCNTQVTIGNTEIEKEKDLDIDTEIEKEIEIDIEPEAEQEKPKGKAKRFTKPTLAEVQAYCNERNNNVDAEHFYDYYEANGWKVGKNSMKDWKASVRTWERNGYSDNNNKTAPTQKPSAYSSGNPFLDMLND